MLSSLNFAAGPIEQFNVYKLMDLSAGGVDLSFTNASAYMVLGSVLVILLFWMGASKGQIVPTRLQSIAEIGYGFVADMVRGVAGEEGLKFFPFVFSLFMFILFANLLGMIPFFFTTTSHIIVTFALAMMVILLVLGYGIYKNGLSFFKLFVPSGIPWILYILITPLEIISFLSRPISLSVRLWANMLAGHILLKLFAGFAVMMVTAFGLFPGVLGALIPFTMTAVLVPLEFLVAFVQAYVFALLTCVYLSDALHPGHH